MPFTVTVNRQALVNLGVQPGGPLTLFWLRLLADIDRRAKMKLSGTVLHVRTGNLRSSQQQPFITHQGGRIVGVVQNVASYAAALHEGAKGHYVRPVRGRYLTGWQYEGAPVFTKLAFIPQQPPRPWLRDSMTEAMKAAGIT